MRASRSALLWRRAELRSGSSSSSSSSSSSVFGRPRRLASSPAARTSAPRRCRRSTPRARSACPRRARRPRRACAALHDARDRIEPERLREPLELGDRRRELAVGDAGQLHRDDHRRWTLVAGREPAEYCCVSNIEGRAPYPIPTAAANPISSSREPARRLGVQHVAGVGDRDEPASGSAGRERLERGPKQRRRALAADEQRGTVHVRELGVARAVRDERDRVGADLGPALRASARGTRAGSARSASAPSTVRRKNSPAAGPPSVATRRSNSSKNARCAPRASGRRSAASAARSAPRRRRASGRRPRELERDHRAEARADDDRAVPTTTPRDPRRAPRRWCARSRGRARPARTGPSATSASWIDQVVWSVALPWTRTTRGRHRASP